MNALVQLKFAYEHKVFPADVTSQLTFGRRNSPSTGVMSAHVTRKIAVTCKHFTALVTGDYFFADVDVHVSSQRASVHKRLLAQNARIQTFIRVTVRMQHKLVLVAKFATTPIAAEWPLNPVRYLMSHESGKTGAFLVADIASELAAAVMKTKVFFQ